MSSEANTMTPTLKELVASLILKTNIPERHAARNALAHIEKAWVLKDIDPSMADFRAMTGVEEATTAIFHALKRCKYKNANLLDKNRHFHKAAVYPFLKAIEAVLSLFNIKTQLQLDPKQKNPKFMIALTIRPFEGTFYPDPPLHYEILINGTLYNFAAEIGKIVTIKNVKSFCDYSNKLAERRNTILYASNKGIPVITITDTYLHEKERQIVNLLVIFLLIAQHKEQQLFVQQALDSYADSLNLVRKEKIKCIT